MKISDNSNGLEIVDKGVRSFLDTYKNTIYDNGFTAKLGIYCGKIETLETVIYPHIAQIVSEYGLNADEVILKYHRGNKDYKVSQEAETEFSSLDTPISKKRIVLLVQIGKEGWDCRSLTGVILSQKGDCPTNMVLQTSCRCLRQVDKGNDETALIWLNKFNADKLNIQLKQQQNISLEEFSKTTKISPTTIDRYQRIDYLKLPAVDFYQLRVHYETLIIETKVEKNFENVVNEEYDSRNILTTQDIYGEITERELEGEEGAEILTFNQWLYLIIKESFGTLKLAELIKYKNQLTAIFEKITYKNSSNQVCLSSMYHQELIRSNIRKEFCDKRSFTTKEDIVPEEAQLLKVDNFEKKIETTNSNKYYPNKEIVKKIIDADKGLIKMDIVTQQAVDALEAAGQHDMAENLKQKKEDIPYREQTYHYLPYKFDSRFEKVFFEQVLIYPQFKSLNLEIYFNGARELTEFKIACYKKQGKRWSYIGKYTPDFLILNRKDGKIDKAIIVETKGKIYSTDTVFIDKRTFMEENFITQNNEKFGYKRFDYLYLEDTLNEVQLIAQTTTAIKNIFGE